MSFHRADWFSTIGLAVSIFALILSQLTSRRQRAIEANDAKRSEKRRAEVTTEVARQAYKKLAEFESNLKMRSVIGGYISIDGQIVEFFKSIDRAVNEIGQIQKIDLHGAAAAAAYSDLKSRIEAVRDIVGRQKNSVGMPQRDKDSIVLNAASAKSAFEAFVRATDESSS